MEYRDALLFTRVVETGSFTAAAGLLGVPKSSVSRAIARLEDDLGVRLLQRTTRRLGLTDAGQSFFERVRSALASLDEAEAAVRAAGEDPRGTVRLTAPADAAALGLAEAVAAFVKTYPAIRVELILTSRIVDLVGEGIDLALRAGTLRDSTLIARRVGSLTAGLFAAPTYLAGRGRPKNLGDLARHDWLLFRVRGDRTTVSLTGPRGDETVDVHGPVSADDLGFLLRAAVAGAGIGLFPMALVRNPVERRELETVLPEFRQTGAALHLVLPSSAFVPARVALLRDFLARFLFDEIESVEKRCRAKARTQSRPNAPAARKRGRAGSAT